MNLLMNLLYALPEETAHHISLSTLKLLHQLQSKKSYTLPQNPFTYEDMIFPNPIGLAAGFDKHGDYFHALGRLGFGFIEIGTVTPKPQPGNPKPRLFRLNEAQAIINRMGFNSKGMDHMAKQVEKHRAQYPGILGINLGKNADTAIDLAHQDYRKSMERLYPLADYLTLNISSPNTRNLRALQDDQYLIPLLDTLSETRDRLSSKHGKHIPLFIKISPDLTQQQTTELVSQVEHYGLNGLIACNTTIARPEGVSKHPKAKESGGLSGAPLRNQANQVLSWINQSKHKKTLLIASGGILSKQDLALKKAAGASLFQLYTGLIIQGPNLINELTQLKT
jgi:dihydroorotate dehydrogenase